MALLRALFYREVFPQAARRSGRLPVVKHGSALRTVSLRDDFLAKQWETSSGKPDFVFAFSFQLREAVYFILYEREKMKGMSSLFLSKKAYLNS